MKTLMTFSSVLLSIMLMGPLMGFTGGGHPVLQATDSTAVEVRRPPVSVLEDFRSDPDFQYRVTEVSTESWWDQFVEWLLNLIGRLFDRTEQSTYWRYFFYAIAIAVIVYAVLQLFKMDGTRLFSRHRAGARNIYEGISDELHAHDFLAMARDAEALEHYREAVRMYYLHVLSILDEQGSIAWAPKKTNRDYVNECRQAEFIDAFERLTYLFDYAWYGHFPVDKSMAMRMQSLARGIENKAGVAP